jgi:GTP cyclohydrolase I
MVSREARRAANRWASQPEGAGVDTDYAEHGETDNVIELDCATRRAAWFELPAREIAPEDWERYTRYVAEIFGAFGMELDGPGTRNTPERYLQALFDATAGYDGEPKLLTAFPAEGNGHRSSTSQIIEGPIAFQSLCEHHALPFHGFAHIGYIAGDRIIGISKLTRLVRLFARRFTVQERLGEQIADGLVELIAPQGVAVHLEASHLCTQMRGVEEHSRTITTFWRGAFDEPDLRREFLHEVRSSGRG